jgi:hypothetical protein
VSFGIHCLAALRRGRADRRRVPARGSQQHQRDGTRLPASDPSRHPEWRDDHGSALRFAGRPSRCKGGRRRQWDRGPCKAPGERVSFSATLVTQLVTQAVVINMGATIEMHSDEAEQWSG